MVESNTSREKNFIENSWIGKKITIGEDIVLRVITKSKLFIRQYRETRYWSTPTNRTFITRHSRFIKTHSTPVTYFT